jgi:hypothetical protein
MADGWKVASLLLPLSCAVLAYSSAVAGAARGVPFNPNRVRRAIDSTPQPLTIKFDNVTNVRTCDSRIRTNCASLYKDTNTT